MSTALPWFPELKGSVSASGAVESNSEIEQILSDAVRAGKLVTASKPRWRAALKANLKAARAQIDGLASLGPVDEERVQARSEVAASTALPNSWFPEIAARKS